MQRLSLAALAITAAVSSALQIEAALSSAGQVGGDNCSEEGQQWVLSFTGEKFDN